MSSASFDELSRKTLFSNCMGLVMSTAAQQDEQEEKGEQVPSESWISVVEPISSAQSSNSQQGVNTAARLIIRSKKARILMSQK